MSKLFVVASPSASGKTTLVDYVSKEHNLYKLKTCTTRPIRKGETGDEYYFLNKPCFEFKMANGEFIEQSEVYGNYYGVLRTEIEKTKNRNCIIILDVQGKEIVENEFDIISIFIKPPDKDVVLERLNSRNTNKEDVKARIEEFYTELEHLSLYKHVIEYGELKYMENQMECIIRDELMST